MLYLNRLSNLSKHIKYLRKKLKKYNIFIVGGSLRDILLGINSNPNDIDLSLPGIPQNIFDKIDKSNIDFFKTDKYGTITLIPKDLELLKIYKNTNLGLNLKYEITPFRTEDNYDDKRHPNKVNWTEDLILDSNRRDFSLNSMYYTFLNYKSDNSDIHKNIKFYEILDILKSSGYIYIENINLLILSNGDIIKSFNNNYKKSRLNNKLYDFLSSLTQSGYFVEGLSSNNKTKKVLNILIDPHKGIDDLLNKKICAVGNPDDRFGEDALRIIRAMRILNLLNCNLNSISKKKDSYFDFEQNTWKSMKKNFFLIKYISNERIREEIVKVFKNNNPFGFIGMMDELNILQFIFPSLYKCKNINQPIRYHPFDVYAHTLLCLHNIQQINTNYLVKLGMLFHDIGKPLQYYYNSLGAFDDNKDSNYNKIHHCVIGEELIIEELKNLTFSKNEIEEISFYVRYHMVPGEILDSKDENIPKKLTKLISKFGYTKLKNIMDIAIADRFGQFNPIQPPNINGIKNLISMIDLIYQKQGEFNLKSLTINGNDIIKKYNINSGPIIGKLLNKALNFVLEDVQNRNHKNTIFEYLDGIIDKIKQNS